MKSFLETVVDDLIGRRGLDGLGEVTMVFPMQRAGLFVRRDIMQRVKEAGDGKPVLLPHFTTIDALSDSLSELGSEDEVVSICRLYAAYKEHTSDTLPLDAFYGWGTQLMTDFSNSDMADTDVSRLMASAGDAAELDTLQLEDETRERLLHLLGTRGEDESVRRYFTSLWNALPAIYETFTHSQQTDGVGTRGARSRWVLQHFEEERVQSRVAGRTFVFVGFNYLLAAERKLMLLLREHAETLFYWDEDRDFGLDESIYKFIRDDVALFGNNLPQTDTDGDAKDGKQREITAIACAGSAAQAAYVHRWLTEHHKEGDKTAIVLADESMLQSVIYSLPDGKEDERFRQVNVTKGYPLRQTRIYADLVREMERPAYSELSPDAVLEKLSRYLETDYHHEQRTEEGSWQQVLRDEAYYQTQMVLRNLRVLLRDDEWVQREITTVKMLRRLICRRLESVSIPFHGEPITDIQVIGVLETRLLDFDNVLILHVEEGVVPNTAVDRSFIPYDMRKAYGMQTRDEESKIYGYNFFRLLRRAGQVTLTYSEAATDMGQKTMSRFLMQMLVSPDYEVQRLRLEESSVTERAEMAPTVIGEGEHFPDHLSPSAISDYVECPREFYLKHIRGVWEPQEESVMFTVSTFGTLVHDTLKYYHRAKGEISLSEALDKAYAERNDDFNRHHPDAEPNPYCRAEHETENHAILTMAEAVRSKDAEQKPNILLLEEEIQPMLQLQNGEKMAMKCKLDRMDSLQENDRKILRIADYKTGRYDEKKLSFESMEELFTDSHKRYALQTLIYCAVFRQAVEDKDLRLASLADYQNLPLVPELLYPRNMSANSHLRYKGQDVTDYVGQCAEEFEPMLREKLSALRHTTEFPPVEPKPCEDSGCYCPFHRLCGREKKEYF